MIRPLVLCLLCLASLAQGARGQGEPSIEPVASRPAWRAAPVIDGEVLVPLVPVAGAMDPLLASRAAWAPRAPGFAVFDDGSRVPVRVRRLVATPPRALLARTGAGATWSSAPARWEEADDETPMINASVWLATVRVPAGASDAPSLEIGGRAVHLFAPPPMHEARTRAPDDEVFRRAVAPVDADPTRRWRCAWIGCSSDDAIDDPLARAWAVAETARWNEAIRRLAQADAMTARLVEHRLVAIADPARPPLPVWSTDRAESATLVRELLEPGAPAASLALAGEAWLGRAAPAVVWVVDDAPLMPEGRLPSARMGLVSLSAQRVAPVLTTLRGPARLAPVLEAGPVRETVLMPVGEGAASDVVIAAYGDWDSRLEVVTSTLVAAPPGFTTSDFYPDETRATFGTGRAPAMISDRRTRAVLRRLGPERWQVVVECLGTAAEGEDARDEVTLWLGAMGEGRSISLRSDAPNSDDAWVRIEDERWLAGFAFDLEDDIDRDGLLRMGIVRVDHRGVRTAWPRPMLPGQAEPGRLAIDTSAWAMPGR